MSDIEYFGLTDSDTTCHICYAEFLDPDDLNIHIKQMHDIEKPVLKSCQFCPEQFTDLESYALHIRDIHLSVMKCCKYCNRVFLDYDLLRKHESKHYSYIKKSKYSCSNCSLLFTNIDSLENHELEQHPYSTEGVFLNDCLSILSSLINIKAIRFLQFLGDDVVYVCVKCEHTTPDVTDYIKHLKKKHCQSYACDICSSVFKSKVGLRKHFNKRRECCLGNLENTKQCPECYESFDITKWSAHKANCKPIKCRRCQMIFDTVDELSQHQIDIHPLTMTLETCKYCHKSFAGNRAVEKHIERAHKHESHLYKYLCVYCDALFKHPKNLFAHFFSTHKDLEPYTCKICDKKFKMRKRFTIHIKLDHKSIGYTEFDEKYNVYFSDKKPEIIKSIAKSEVETVDKNILGQPLLQESNNEKIPADPEILISIDSKEVSYCDENNQVDDDKAYIAKEISDMDIDFLDSEAINIQEVKEMSKITKRRFKRKYNRKTQSKAKSSGSHKDILTLDSSDDEPLIKVRKKERELRKVRLRNATWNRKKRVNVKDKKKRFVCNVCKKYCYTFQNYNNHVSTHFKNVATKCVKCSEEFSSKEALDEHYSKEHSNSKLTETLKSLLEKRRNRASDSKSSKSNFELTIKKVTESERTEPARIKPVTKGMSAKNFLESFTRELDISKKDIIIDSEVIIKPMENAVKKSSIKMTKCNLLNTPYSLNTKLSMPVPFKKTNEDNEVIVKITPVSKIDIQIDEAPNNGDEINPDEDSIPEVAEEILLEGSEEKVSKALNIPPKFLLNLQKDCKDMYFAHLQAEAPYYKIVKAADALKAAEEKPQPKSDYQLPDGTKLVTVNPLAHLLGDTPIEKLVDTKRNKYYQSKPIDFEKAIANAMLKLKQPEVFPKTRRRKVVDK